MSLNPILLTAWAVLAIAFFGLLIYRGQLTRYEDEQLFLGDSANRHEMEEHDAIVKRVEKLRPILSTVGAAAGLTTALAVGTYVWNAYLQINQ